jgi:hypothetical protein
VVNKTIQMVPGPMIPVEVMEPQLISTVARPAISSSYSISRPAAYPVFSGSAYGSAYPGRSVGLSAAGALDAADGVIDGKFYGSQIVSAPIQGSSFTGSSFTGSSYPMTTGATSFGATSFGATSYGAVPSAPMSLDAADGMIDGKFFGSQIASAPFSFANSFPASTMETTGLGSSWPTTTSVPLTAAPVPASIPAPAPAARSADPSSALEGLPVAPGAQ